MTWRLVSLRFRNKWPCEFLSEKSRNRRKNKNYIKRKGKHDNSECLSITVCLIFSGFEFPGGSPLKSGACIASDGFAPTSHGPMHCGATALGLLPGLNGPKTLLIGPGMVFIPHIQYSSRSPCTGFFWAGADHQSVVTV